MNKYKGFNIWMSEGYIDNEIETLKNKNVLYVLQQLIDNNQLSEEYTTALIYARDYISDNILFMPEMIKLLKQLIFDFRGNLISKKKFLKIIENVFGIRDTAFYQTLFYDDVNINIINKLEDE